MLHSSRGVRWDPDHIRGVQRGHWLELAFHSDTMASR
jgi:hypothetical protein